MQGVQPGSAGCAARQCRVCSQAVHGVQPGSAHQASKAQAWRWQTAGPGSGARPRRRSAATLARHPPPWHSCLAAVAGRGSGCRSRTCGAVAGRSWVRRACSRQGEGTVLSQHLAAPQINWLRQAPATASQPASQPACCCCCTPLHHARPREITLTSEAKHPRSQTPSPPSLSQGQIHHHSSSTTPRTNPHHALRHPSTSCPETPVHIMP